MKNALNYYYNLAVNDIHQKNKIYYFNIDGYNYLFEECYRNLNEIYELYNLEFYLYNYNIYLHQFILNKDNELITKINNKKYILMRMFINDDKKISIDDITKFEKIKIIPNYNLINKNNWRMLWINKIDYIEERIEENKNKFKTISQKIDYYIGITENAIQLLYDMNNDNNLYLSHIRIKYDYSISELYNPLNIVLDSRVRDLSEYYKNVFFRNKLDSDLLNEILKKISLYTINEQKLFFIRMLFPSSFFDIYDEIILKKLDDTKIYSVINMTNDFEFEIRKIYLFLFQKGILPDIEWLKKM